MQKPTKVENIAIELIDDFPDHPFRVNKNSADMADLIFSIVWNGITSPLLLWERENGRYTLLSGHRRKYVCTQIGHKTVPALVYRDITPDEATIIMVDENAKREKLLPSEKAFAYKMKLDAMKRQGKRNDLTCGQNVHKLSENKTRAEIGENSGESGRQIQRYIRLTNLLPIILQSVDEGELGFMCGVEISFLSPKQQQMLVDAIAEMQYIPNLRQAKALKMAAREGKLTADEIRRILSQVRLDCRVTFRMQPNQLKRLEEESEKGEINRSELLRTYASTGGTVYIGQSNIDALYEIETNVSRIGNLLIMNINRLSALTENPLLVESQSELLKNALDEDKKLREEILKIRLKLNRVCGNIRNELDTLNKVSK